MDHVKVLKRAWHTVWNYRALWVFGIILALTTTSWSSAAWHGHNGDRDDNRDQNMSRLILPGNPHLFSADSRLDEAGEIIVNYNHEYDDMPYQKGDIVVTYNAPDDYAIGVVARDKEGQPDLKSLEIRPGVVSTLVALGIGLAIFLVLLLIVTPVARYVGETALIRMVDVYEESGERHSLRRGFRLGWSRTAWRLFLIDLLVNVTVGLAFILLFALVALPLLLVVNGGIAALSVGIVFSGGFLFVAIALAVVTGAALSLLKRVFRRACALDELGVIEAIRRGYAIVRQNLKDAGLMWLVTIGVNLAWPFLVAPIVFLLLGVGTVLGGASALLARGLAGLAWQGAMPWVAAGVVGIPIFILALVAPLAFLGGLREVFLSSMWTLTYRELRSLESLEPGQSPALDASGLEVAVV